MRNDGKVMHLRDIYAQVGRRFLDSSRPERDISAKIQIESYPYNRIITGRNVKISKGKTSSIVAYEKHSPPFSPPLDLARNSYEGSSIEGLSTFIGAKDISNECVKNLFEDLRVEGETDETGRGIAEALNKFIKGVYSIIESKDSYTKVAVKQLGKNCVHEIKETQRTMLRYLEEQLKNPQSISTDYPKEVHSIIRSLRTTLHDIKQEELKRREQYNNQLKHLLTTLSPKIAIRDLDTKKLIDLISTECDKLMLLSKSQVEVRKSNVQIKKSNVGGISKQESEGLIEELTAQNFKLENELTALNSDAESKDRIISNLTKENEKNEQENRELCTAAIKLYSLINSRTPTTKKPLSIISAIEKDVNELKKSKELLLRDKVMLENKITLLKNEALDFKEGAKTVENLLNKIYELEDQIEELKKDKENFKKSEEKLLQDNAESKETIEECIELTIESIVLMKAVPEKTKKLTTLCTQLKNTIAKLS